MKKCGLNNPYFEEYLQSDYGVFASLAKCLVIIEVVWPWNLLAVAWTLESRTSMGAAPPTSGKDCKDPISQLSSNAWGSGVYLGYKCARKKYPWLFITSMVAQSTSIFYLDTLLKSWKIFI
jgi:hypothetical protein